MGIRFLDEQPQPSKIRFLDEAAAEPQPHYADVPYTSTSAVPLTRERKLSELSPREMVMGAIETPVALAATIAGAPLSILTSRATPEVKAAVRPFQYEPRSELAQRAVSALGEATSGLPPYIPSVGGAPAAAREAGVARAARQGAATEQQATQLLQNAVRDATLTAGAKEGLLVTPGAVSPTGPNILLERMAGKTRLEQLASVRNQTTVDRMVRRAVDIPETAPLTSEMMEKIRKQEFTKGYEPLASVGKVATDDTYLANLAKIEEKYTGPEASFPGAVPENVSKLVNIYARDSFDAKDAVKITRTLRQQAQSNFKKGENDLALAQRDIVDAIENQLQRSIETSGRSDAAQMLQQFRDSRQRMAISHAIEDAIIEGTGSVDARKLASALQRGKYMTGELRTAAEFTNAFPRVMQPASQIGAPGAGTVLGASLGGLGGGGLGGLVAGVPGASVGGAIGAVAPQAMSAAVRNYLLSPLGQRRTLPRYDPAAETIARDIAARNELLMQRSPVENALAR